MVCMTGKVLHLRWQCHDIPHACFSGKPHSSVGIADWLQSKCHAKLQITSESQSYFLSSMEKLRKASSRSHLPWDRGNSETEQASTVIRTSSWMHCRVQNSTFKVGSDWAAQLVASLYDCCPLAKWDMDLSRSCHFFTRCYKAWDLC